MVLESSPLGRDERLSRIETVTDTELAHLDLDHLLAELLDRVVDLLRADTAAVLLSDADSGHLITIAARGIGAELRQGALVRVGSGCAGRVARERRPVMVEEAAAGLGSQVLLEAGVSSALGVPMLSAGDLVGVLQVGSLEPRRFSDEEVKLLQLVADRVALATQVGRTAAERAAAGALQRSLLPAALPERPDLELAARYIPGGSSGVGGDWYDVFALPSGELAIVVGDVVGHGLGAAVVMGRLRSALRAYALEWTDPGEVLRRLDRKALHFEPGLVATVVYAVLDPGSGRLSASLAGHPPPLVAVPGRETEFVDLPVDLLIGVEPGIRRRTTTVELPPGALLCLYTDGLVERRDRSPEERLEQLRDTVVVEPAEAVCSTLLRGMLAGRAPADDVAILVARRLG